MASRVIKEPLNGGINQVKHPLLLRAGELQRATNCILRPGDTALHKAPGRTSYGTVRSVSVDSTTHANLTLTSDSAAFGTDLSAVTFNANDNVLTRAAGWGAAEVGQSIWGTGIPTGAVIVRLGVDGSTTKIEISSNTTAANTGGGGGQTVTFSDYYVGTWITGNGISLYTAIASIQSASSLTLSAAATTGSVKTNRTFSEKIVGLRVLTFNHGYTDLMIAKCQDKLYRSNFTSVAGGASFTELASGLSNNALSILDSIHFDENRYTLLTGYDIPRILFYTDDGTSKTVQLRTLGMFPVPEAAFIGPIRVDGTWSNLTDLGDGFYYFLVTEVAKFNDGSEVEGTYTGDPQIAKITNHETDAIQITYFGTGGRPVNDGNYGKNRATHWRLYMSTKQSEELPVPDLADFVRIGSDIPISFTAPDTYTTDAVTLKDANPFVAGFASVLATDGSYAALFPSSSVNALAQSPYVVQSVTCTISGNTLTATTGDFTNVKVGMYIQNGSNYIPFGAYVKSKTSSTVLIMSETATTTITGETVWFGNDNTFNGAYSLCPVNPDGGGTNHRSGIFRNFGIKNIGSFSTATITGIEVHVKGAFNEAGSTDTGFVVEVSRDSTTFSNTNTVVAFKKHNIGEFSPSLEKVGGEFDLWGVSGWDPNDFIDGATKFGVRLRKIYGGDGEKWTHLIDGVKVIIHAGGHSINLEGDNFRTITTSDQLGVAFSTGANGPPPTASTGDLFEGMLILNDKENENIIVGSLPGEYEAFPDAYHIPIGSKDRDTITLLRRLNNMLIVGCKSSVKRLNYFPRETDAEFSKGRCYEDLTLDHGIVGPRAAKIIDLPDRGAVLAYLAHNGLHFTDGTITHFLNDDIDWENLIEPAYIDQSILEVYPRLNLLALYYVPAGVSQTRIISVMYFSYHPIHVKEGTKLPAVGPTSVEVGSTVRTLLTGKNYLLTGHNLDGKVYLEDSGDVDASGYTLIEPSIRTRQFFSADLGRTGRVSRLFVFADPQGTSTTGGFTCMLTRQNQGEAATNVESVLDRTTEIGGIIELWADNAGETFYLTLDKSESASQTSALDIHFVGLEWTASYNDLN